VPTQYTWQRDNFIPISLMLEVQVDNIPVSGISPTVEIYKYSNHKHADFDTNTFVSAGGNKFGVMSGVPSNEGLYHFPFSPQDFGEVGSETYYMRYRAVVPSGYGGGLVEEDTEIIGSEVHYFTELAGSGFSIPVMTASAT